MQDSIGPEHHLHRNVQEILSASRRAADLTRQLLAFGRKQTQTLQILNLNTVLRDISRLLPRLIGEDVELTIAPEADLGKVKLDPVQLEQIVMNLAANARDAMPAGGKLTIATHNVELDDAYVQTRTVVPPGQYVLLEVSDSGQGIDPEHLPQEIVMPVEDMMDAALAGFDQEEFVTLPALPDAGQWESYEAARQALMPNLSCAEPAGRYGVVRAAG